MNILLLPIYLSLLISLTTSFYQQCDCPQCNQYSLRVQRCACCVYLLNGKRSTDSRTIHHRGGSDAKPNVHHSSRPSKGPSNWIDTKANVHYNHPTNWRKIDTNNNVHHHSRPTRSPSNWHKIDTRANVHYNSPSEKYPSNWPDISDIKGGHGYENNLEALLNYHTFKRNPLANSMSNDRVLLSGNADELAGVIVLEIDSV